VGGQFATTAPSANVYANFDASVNGSVSGTVAFINDYTSAAITETYGGTITNATLASFTDAYTGDPLSAYVATVNWGDGHSTSGMVSGSNGSFTVTGSHTDAAANTHTIAVTLTDDGAVPGTATVDTSATIKPATLTYVSNTASMTYGSAIPALSGMVTGFVNGDTENTATTGTLTFTTAATSSPVGSYAITGSGLSATNYTFTQAAANSTALTVTAAPLTITANYISKVYGAVLPTLTVSYSGLVNGDTSASLTTQPMRNTMATASSPVGSYAITVSGAGAANYSIQYVSGTLSVAPATLTVTAKAQIMQQGTVALPSLAASYSGFVLGQTLATSGVAGSPSFSTTATSSSPVGAYPITVAQGTLASANYTFQFVNSILYVTSSSDTVTSSQSTAVTTSKPATASTMSSGSNSPQMTATASGFNGTLTVAQFGQNPNPAFFVSGAYFDLNVTPQQGASLDAAAVTVQLQNLTANAPLLWWNGSSWAQVSEAARKRPSAA